MPKHFLDLDEVMTLHEPITFKVNKKTYTVNGITDEILSKVDAMATAVQGDDSKGPCELIANQIAIFAGAKSSEFAKLELHVLKKIIRHITENINDPLAEAVPESGAEA